jgi:hypothetical protein
MALRQELSSGMIELDHLSVGEFEGRISKGTDSLWLILRRRHSGLALRLAYMYGSAFECRAQSRTENLREFSIHGEFGDFRVAVRIVPSELPMWQVTAKVQPSRPLVLAPAPRDLYPLGDFADPASTRGEVMAAQKGLNTAMLYAAIREPQFGTLLYLQDLTSLNEYFRLTETKPDGVVGGQWPELGYSMPVNERKPLPPSREITLSDLFLVLTPDIAGTEPEKAQRYLDFMAAVYPHLDRPATDPYDWPRQARKTLRDLQSAETVRQRFWGELYLRPYNDAEYPDSMTQLNILAGLASNAGSPRALARLS